MKSGGRFRLRVPSGARCCSGVEEHGASTRHCCEVFARNEEKKNGVQETAVWLYERAHEWRSYTDALCFQSPVYCAKASSSLTKGHGTAQPQQRTAVNNLQHGDKNVHRKVIKRGGNRRKELRKMAIKKPKRRDCTMISSTLQQSESARQCPPAPNTV